MVPALKEKWKRREEKSLKKEQKRKKWIEGKTKSVFVTKLQLQRTFIFKTEYIEAQQGMYKKLFAKHDNFDMFYERYQSMRKRRKRIERQQEVNIIK